MIGFKVSWFLGFTDSEFQRSKVPRFQEFHTTENQSRAFRQILITYPIFSKENSTDLHDCSVPVFFTTFSVFDFPFSDCKHDISQNKFGICLELFFNYGDGHTQTYADMWGCSWKCTGQHLCAHFARAQTGSFPPSDAFFPALARTLSPLTMPVIVPSRVVVVVVVREREKEWEKTNQSRVSKGEKKRGNTEVEKNAQKSSSSSSSHQNSIPIKRRRVPSRPLMMMLDESCDEHRRRHRKSRFFFEALYQREWFCCFPARDSSSWRKVPFQKMRRKKKWDKNMNFFLWRRRGINYIQGMP